MTITDMYYHDFAYAAGQLSAYIRTLDFFVISLRSGKVVSYAPADAQDFTLWLCAHQVRDISIDNGTGRKNNQY